MVSKTKRVLAMILTGMMAAAALTGCQEKTNTQQSSSGGTASSQEWNGKTDGTEKLWSKDEGDRAKEAERICNSIT